MNVSSYHCTVAQQQLTVRTSAFSDNFIHFCADHLIVGAAPDNATDKDDPEDKLDDIVVVGGWPGTKKHQVNPVPLHCFVLAHIVSFHYHQVHL